MKRNAIASMKDEVAAWRRAFHQNPGLAYQEHFASEFIQQKLTEWGIPFKAGIGKTGVVATIVGTKNDSGKRIGLRADMDALPIREQSGQPWASQTDGLMHGCGHDGHAATLLGFAKYLNETRNFNGTALLIFQPAEEGARGAFAMMEDGLFKGDLDCDAVYAYHNWPYLPLGKGGTRSGGIMASVDEFTATIMGKGGHAAYPHKCIDPVIVFTEIAAAFQTIVSRIVPPQESAVLSITNVNGGTGAFNVIADRLTFTGTVRTYSPDVRDLMEQRMKEMAASIAAAHGATCTIAYDRNIDATINHAAHATIAADTLARILGDENIDRNAEASMGGEDFGGMLAVKQGAYIYIGQGVADAKSPHSQSLHHPCYDFNDDVLPIAMDFMAELVETQMPLNG